MKKIFTIFLVAIIIFTATIQVSAINTEEEPSVTTRTNQQYGYQFTEYVEENGRVTRKYEKTISTSQSRARSVADTASNTDTTLTKALLADLGMGEEFIEALSDESLNMYANAESITTTATYIRTDAEGNATIIDEQTALNTTSNENARVITLPEDFGDGTGNAGSPYSEASLTEDMYILFVVTYKGDGLYHYSVDAEWLDAPEFRETDCIGMCAQDCAIIEGSHSGWLSYRLSRKDEDDVVFHYDDVQEAFESQDFQDRDLATWSGSGVVFNLYYDIPKTFDCPITYEYSNFKIHYEFSARIRNVSNESYFNARASYEHTIVELVATPSVVLSQSNLETSIGFDIVNSSIRTVVKLDDNIHYVP